MLRILIYGLVIYLAYKFVKKLFPTLFEPAVKGPENHGTDEDTELIKDPECGTYFMRQRGVKAHIAGNTIYFCSEACRNKFLNKQRH